MLLFSALPASKSHLLPPNPLPGSVRQLASFSLVYLLQVLSDTVETCLSLVNQNIVSSKKSLKNVLHIVSILTYNIQILISFPLSMGLLIGIL